MRKITALVFALLLPASGLHADAPDAYTMPRTQVVPIKDTQADRQYELYIKLPEAYEEDTDKRFPVIYATDGIWQMDLLSGNADFLIPDAILVGISWQKDARKEIDDDRPHVSRFRDYSMVPHDDPAVQSKYSLGQARNHTAFIRNDVIAYVEENFRTAPGKRAYLGYSMGGSFGAYILFAEPDTFDHYILGSPAFDPRNIEFITDMAARSGTAGKEMNARVFVSIGELEENEMAVTKSFVSLLQRQAQAGLVHTDLQIIKGSDHTTAVPETFTRGIKWLASHLHK